MSYTIEEIKRIVAPIARRHGVDSVSLFGSHATGTALDTSDVDLKIEKGNIKSLFQLSGFRLDVEAALQRPVDLITSEINDAAFLAQIAAEEVLLYRAAR